jgi:asparagine synthase (glutamine-hydrolysing)
MVHRGPDGSGVWVDVDGRCALGHRRLSIIDTSYAGAQPFSSHDRRWWVTFNGEIYNFKDIRAQLERKGRVFRSKSDTEVLVEALAIWGASAVEKFDGMFAFAAFDTLRGELLLARDPFGEKPLYFTTLTDGTLAFASELRALEILPGLDRTINVDAVAEYLMFQYIGAPRTIYEQVFKLPTAHLMLKSEGPAEVRRYYRFEPGKDLFQNRSMSDLADELEDILVRSIERRLISDVPLGAFLSGGVDSSLVCALVTQRLRVPLNTYSVGFHDAPESEHLVAREFANHLGTIHHEKIVSPNVDEFLDVVGGVLDEPNADTSCLPTYLLARFAREGVTVAISGDGGDEMFGGYGRYTRTLLERDVHELGELPLWNAGKSYYGPGILIASENEVEDLLGDVPQSFRTNLLGLRTEIDSGRDQLLASLRRSDVENYLPGAVLPKVDRMGMQHSLEVRTPFLNVDLANFAERLPESLCAGRSFTKRLLRELACRYLPPHLVNLPKQGFGLPMANWARNSLLPRAMSMLSVDSVLRRSVGESRIDRLLTRHSAPNGFNAYQLWSVVVLEAWLRERHVELPSISPSMQARRGLRPASQDRSVDWAIPMAKNLWVVVAGHPSERPEVSVAELDARLNAKLCELQVDRERPPINARPEVLQLSSPSTKSTDRDGQFEGATLLFVDRDAPVRIGATECRNLRALRVRRIVMPHRSLGHEFEDFEFCYKRPLRDSMDLARLWHHRIGAFAKKGNWTKIAGVASLSPAGTKLFHVGPLDKIPLERNVELTDRYAVFEALEQCPPFRMGFDEVELYGDGRYCVFNQTLGASFTKASTGKGRVIWAVPINQTTAPYLQIRPTRLSKRARTLHYDDLFGQFVQSVSNTTCITPLAPGDRIVVLTHALPAGGAERQWVYLAKALQKLGFKVTFVVLTTLSGENAHYLASLRGAGIELLQVCDLPSARQEQRFAAKFQGGFSNFPQTTALAQTVNAIRLVSPRVIFAQLDSPNIVAAMAGLLCDVDRIVVSFRNYNPSNFDYINNDWLLPAYRAISSSPKVILTGNCSGANEDYANWIGVPKSRISNIPNALDRDLFTAATPSQTQHVRLELGVPAGTPVVLGVFRFSAEKGPVDFAKAAVRIAEESDAVHILVAGVGSLEAEVRHHFNASAARDRFRLLGRREDISALMSISSLLLHAGRKEGMPNVIIEAMISGLPVVATDAGATGELVVNGETGFIHEIGDLDGLAKSCLRILSQPDLASRMKEAIAFQIKDQFSPEKMAQRYLGATGLYNLAAPDGRSSPAMESNGVRFASKGVSY